MEHEIGHRKSLESRVEVTQPWPKSEEGIARTSNLFDALDALLAAEKGATDAE